MHGYSDRIHHAFAFAAKHYVPRAPATGSADFIAHPGNLAVILSRYSADQPTVVAGVLHLVLEETAPDARQSMEQNIGIKFGSVVLAIARDAVETRFDARGCELPDRVYGHPTGREMVGADQPGRTMGGGC